MWDFPLTPNFTSRPSAANKYSYKFSKASFPSGNQNKTHSFIHSLTVSFNQFLGRLLYARQALFIEVNKRDRAPAFVDLTLSDGERQWESMCTSSTLDGDKCHGWRKTKLGQAAREHRREGEPGEFHVWFPEVSLQRWYLSTAGWIGGGSQGES